MIRPALALALLFASSPLFAAGAMPQTQVVPPSSRAAAAPAPAAAATIAEISGEPEVLLDGVEPWMKASAGMQLTPGSKIRTGAGSATLLFFDGSKVRISEHADFTLEGAESSSIALFLGMGKLQAWVAKLRSRTFKTRTPTAVASVRGTKYDLSTDGKNTTINLYQGSLAVNNNFGQSTLLSAGQSIQTGVSAPAPGKTGTTPAFRPVALPPNMTMPPEPKLTMAPPMMPPPGATPAQQQMAVAPPPGTQFVTDLSMMPPPPPNAQQNNAVAPRTCPTAMSPSAPCP